MRSLCIASLCALSLSCGSGEIVADDTPISSYRVERGWPVIPDGVAFGRPLGVAVDSRGRVFVTHTVDKGSGNAEAIAKPTIFAFDPLTGKLVAQLGAGLFRYPHGISIDRDDALWITDSEANRVYKLSQTGEILLTLGVD